MSTVQIKHSKIDAEKASKSASKRIVYTSAFFGFEKIAGDGKYVRLAILDSGVPNHTSIVSDIHKTKNFTASGSVYDVYGHASAVSGIIAANNAKQVVGMATKVDLYYGKILQDTDRNNQLQHVVDALLWCLVRDVDIVLMSFGTQYEYEPLQHAIKKLYNSGICMIAASGNHNNKTRDVDFPARYNEVFSVGYDAAINRNIGIKKGSDYKGVVMPKQKYTTTYIDSKYIDIEGSSINAAAVAGLCVLVYADLRRKGLNVKNPQFVYNETARYATKEHS
jgi:hypothetical protein